MRNLVVLFIHFVATLARLQSSPQYPPVAIQRQAYKRVLIVGRCLELGQREARQTKKSSLKEP
jgi:hypothetical protein